MRRQIYLYGLTLAGLLLLLKSIEYKYLIYDYSLEFYIGLLALFFTFLGVWVGRRLTGRATAPALEMLTKAPGQPLDDLGISVREQEVLRLIADGYSNQEIADRLFLSLNTIKKHTSTLFSKLNVERRTQAVQEAKRLGII